MFKKRKEIAGERVMKEEKSLKPKPQKKDDSHFVVRQLEISDWKSIKYFDKFMAGFIEFFDESNTNKSFNSLYACVQKQGIDYEELSKHLSERQANRDKIIGEEDIKKIKETFDKYQKEYRNIEMDIMFHDKKVSEGLSPIFTEKEYLDKKERMEFIGEWLKENAWVIGQ